MQPISAERGHTLRAKSWSTEGLLRLLENVLEIGENPAELVVYAALGKAARDWPSYRAIHQTLLALDGDETLLIQSGKPIGVFRTHPLAPRVLLANCNLVGRWATEEHFYQLYSQNRIAWGGLTAGCWQYIGFQGVLQGTFETFGAAALSHFGTPDLRGRWVVTSGLGGMGSAQPLAVLMQDGVALVAEVDPARAYERQRLGLCQRVTQDLDEAIAWCGDARNKRKALSVAWIGNAVTLMETLAARDLKPDIATDMTSAHDALHGFHPVDFSLEEAASLRTLDPGLVVQKARDSMVRLVRALLQLQEQGVAVFDYGNNLRSQARDHGFADAFKIKVFTEAYLRPLFCQGIGPFRWISLVGSVEDIAWIDALAERLFADQPRVVRWLAKARRHVPFQGLPARTAWLGHGQRTAIALEVNQAIATGEISGPVAFTRDHLDAGSMAHPNIMTENLLDGTDAVADWPILNALLNTANGADLVAVHSGGGGYTGYMTSAGVTCIADGSAPAAERLQRVMQGDTGLGVLRYADAGYELAQATARSSQLKALNLAAE